MPKILASPPKGIKGREKGQWSDDRQMRNKNKHIENKILTLFPRYCSSRRPPSEIPPLLSSFRWRCTEGLEEGRKGSDQMTSRCVMKNKNIENKILILFPWYCSSRCPPSVIPLLLSSLCWRCAGGLKEGRKGSDQMTSRCVIKNKNIKKWNPKPIPAVL